MHVHMTLSPVNKMGASLTCSKLNKNPNLQRKRMKSKRRGREEREKERKGKQRKGKERKKGRKE